MNFTQTGLKQKYNNKKKNAESRNIEFLLTEDEFISLCLFLKDNRTCPYTGREFVFSATNTGTPKPHYPTLEQVDSGKGYCIGNVIWVCHNAAQRQVGLLLDSNKESYTKEKQKIKEVLDKQSYFCEIVDKECYGIGWVTEIEEISNEI